MEGKNRYDVRIGTNNYVLKTTRSKEETDSIVKYVDAEIESASEQLKYKNPAMHATLACLNIADTLFDISNEYDKLKKLAEEPMREYIPLKQKYDNISTISQSHDNKINELNEKIEFLEEKLKVVELDRDNYKLELDRQINSSQKDKETVDNLRNKLMQQEKQTLAAYKQLQEATRNSENK